MYKVIPLEALLSEEYDPVKLKNAFKKFSCQRETDLENFLVNKAIPYDRSSIGKTSLIVDNNELVKNHNFVIMAYFTIALRALDISNMSTKKRRKMIGEYPGRDNLKNYSAFLIGQLGRCDAYDTNALSGEDILNECYNAIGMAARIVGGNLIILECREQLFPKFYEKNGFKKLYDDMNEEGLYTIYKKVDFKDYWNNSSNGYILN